MASISDANMKETSLMDSVNTANDLQALSIKLELQFRYLTHHEVCSVCTGYYGPCFGEPVCATCHAFLFPEDLGQAEAMAIWESWKKDDGDSGNDEPNDPYFGPERRHSSAVATPPRQAQPIPVIEALLECCEPSSSNQPSTPPSVNPSESNADDNFPVQSPRAVDRLAERLRMLSLPRKSDDFRPGLMERLPPEVLLTVFGYLDDLSLFSASNVCRRWRRLLEAEVADEQWHVFTVHRWPLFRPLYTVKNWWLCYKQLAESAPCQLCLQQMALQSQPTGEENSWRRNRLRNELKNMRLDPPEGIQAVPLDQGCCHWLASILGPQGSPYAGGMFYLYVQVPYSYPMCPPMVRFITRIFHPNVSRHGDVGIDLIHHNWSLAMTVAKVLISVQSLLTDPFCQICMEPSIGQLYMQDKPCFDLMARTWTWRYAMNDAIMPLDSS